MDISKLTDEQKNQLIESTVKMINDYEARALNLAEEKGENIGVFLPIDPAIVPLLPSEIQAKLKLPPQAKTPPMSLGQMFPWLNKNPGKIKVKNNE